MENTKPYISVVIPAYNSATYLSRTLDAILSQKFRNFEVIVVDDGSTDNTPEILNSYRDAIRRTRIDPSGGPSKPRNVGMSLATGEWVSFVDSDDVLMPTRFNSFVECVDKDPSIDFHFSNFQLIDEQDRVFNPDFHHDYKSFKKHLVRSSSGGSKTLQGEALTLELIKANFVGTSGAIVRKALIEKVGGFDESLHYSEDIAAWLALARAGAVFGYSTSISHSYRIHPQNLSGRDIENCDWVIEVLSREKRFATNPAIVRAADHRIREYLLEKAWDLTSLSEFKMARLEFSRANRIGISWRGIKGLIKCKIGAAATR